jgi:D-sedoheptulose 7-phosphate isomerase
MFTDEVRFFREALDATVERITANGALAAAERLVTKAVDRVAQGGIILVCGNGGSAADAAHITAELIGRMHVADTRPPIACINLAADSAVLTALANDYGYDKVFERQVEAHALNACLLIAISTSGISLSVRLAAERAKRHDIPVLGLTGDGGGHLRDHCDVLIEVASRDTATVQQLTQLIYHHLCREAAEEEEQLRSP